MAKSGTDKTALPGWVLWLLIGIAFAVLLGVGIFHGTVGSFLPDAPTKAAVPATAAEVRNQFGLLGDTVGGILNPLLTFVMVLLLLHTMRQNQQMLKASQKTNRLTQKVIKQADKQLTLSRKEMKQSRKELRKSAVAQKEISETQRRQRFENTFFKMMEHHDALVSFWVENPKIVTYEESEFARHLAAHDIVATVLLRLNKSSRLFQYVTFLKYSLELIYLEESPGQYVSMLMLRVPAGITRLLLLMIFRPVSEDLHFIKSTVVPLEIFRFLEFRAIGVEGYPVEWREKFYSQLLDVLQSTETGVNGRAREIIEEYKEALSERVRP